MEYCPMMSDYAHMSNYHNAANSAKIDTIERSRTFHWFMGDRILLFPPCFVIT